jgi:hypothetical protein
MGNGCRKEIYPPESFDSAFSRKNEEEFMRKMRPPGILMLMVS